MYVLLFGKKRMKNIDNEIIVNNIKIMAQFEKSKILHTLDKTIFLISLHV